MNAIRSGMMSIRTTLNQIKTTWITATDFPFITKCIFVILIVISFINKYFDIASLFSNSVNTTIEKQQFYRLITNPISHVVTGAQLTLFVECLRQMEEMYGSYLFLTLFIEINISINCLSLVFCMVGYLFSHNEDYHWMGIASIWPVLLAMTIMKSKAHGDRHATRQVLSMMLPQLFNDVTVPNVLGVVVGYLYGRMEYRMMNAKKVQKWEEEGWLRFIATRPHYVAIVNSSVYKMEEKHDDEIV